LGSQSPSERGGRKKREGTGERLPELRANIEDQGQRSIPRRNSVNVSTLVLKSRRGRSKKPSPHWSRGKFSKEMRLDIKPRWVGGEKGEQKGMTGGSWEKKLKKG